MKKKEKDNLKKYLNEFDEAYRKNMHKKQTVIPIIMKLFEQYEENIYTLSSVEKENHKLKLEISNRLQENCNKEQKDLWEELRYCIGVETGELVEKAFIFGYCVAQSLEDETKNYKGLNENNK